MLMILRVISLLRRMVMRRLPLFGRYLCREVSLLEADGFAVLGSFDEVSLILTQVMSKVCVGQFWRQAMQ